MNQLSIQTQQTMSSLEIIASETISALKNSDIKEIFICHDNFEKIKHLYSMSIQTMFNFFWQDCVNSIIFDNKEEEEEEVIKTYLVQNSTTELFKIGRTKNTIKTRIGQFEGMSGGDIYIIGFVEKDIENKLHRKYKDKRVKGEWFDLSQNDVNEILIMFENHK